MQELDVRFVPANGSPPRTITLRIGAPVRKTTSWFAQIEIVGFDEPYSTHCQGEDWAQVLQLAAMVLPYALEGLVEAAGGGTLDPPFYRREAHDPSAVPPNIRAILDGK